MSAVAWFAAWPVLDDSRDVVGLADGVRLELVEAIARSGWVQAGEPCWHVREGHAVESGRPSGRWLCVEVPVEPVPGPALSVVSAPSTVLARSVARSLGSMPLPELRASADRLLATLAGRYGPDSAQYRSAATRWAAALASAPEPDDLLDVVTATREAP